MNKRIKELLEQAGVKYVTMPKDTVYEKFAELIIDECCERLSEEIIRHDGYGFNQHELYNRLRKHFGIKK